MIELTEAQALALAQAGDNAPTLLDPKTGRTYNLVPANFAKDAPCETSVEPWTHLVIRRHPWRKQLYLKGRNITVRQLVGGVKANQFSEEQAATNYQLPIEAIREALAYFAEQFVAVQPQVAPGIDQQIERILQQLDPG